MTVFVDSPLWRWRGRRWAHMISDSGYDELHRFAQGLGKHRLAFQGDHYDVDEEMRAAAMAAGATVTDCRDLLRRLRSAGLRCRDPWVVLCHTCSPAAETARHLGRLSLGDPLQPAALGVRGALAGPVELVVLQRSTETGVGLHGAAASTIPATPAAAGLEVHVWDVDGRTLVEVVAAR